jgi:hypothetical protein
VSQGSVPGQGSTGQRETDQGSPGDPG